MKIDKKSVDVLEECVTSLKPIHDQFLNSETGCTLHEKFRAAFLELDRDFESDKVCKICPFGISMSKHVCTLYITSHRYLDARNELTRIKAEHARKTERLKLRAKNRKITNKPDKNKKEDIMYLELT